MEDIMEISQEYHWNVVTYMCRCIYIYIYVCTYVWMDGWMDVCMDGWMYVCMYVYMYVPYGRWVIFGLLYYVKPFYYLFIVTR